MDGVKNVCMDKLYKDVKSKSCLIYSFGLSDDWSFEEYMALLGCQVRTVFSNQKLHTIKNNLMSSILG